MTRSETWPQQTDDERAEILRRVQRRAGFQPLKSQHEIDQETRGLTSTVAVMTFLIGAVIGMLIGWNVIA